MKDFSIILAFQIFRVFKGQIGKLKDKENSLITSITVWIKWLLKSARSNDFNREVSGKHNYYCIYESGYKRDVGGKGVGVGGSPFQKSPRILYPSSMLDLNFWDCFGRKKIVRKILENHTQLVRYLELFYRRKKKHVSYGKICLTT